MKNKKMMLAALLLFGTLPLFGAKEVKQETTKMDTSEDAPKPKELSDFEKVMLNIPADQQLAINLCKKAYPNYELEKQILVQDWTVEAQRRSSSFEEAYEEAYKGNVFALQVYSNFLKNRYKNSNIPFGSQELKEALKVILMSYIRTAQDVAAANSLQGNGVTQEFDETKCRNEATSVIKKKAFEKWGAILAQFRANKMCPKFQTVLKEVKKVIDKHIPADYQTPVWVCFVFDPNGWVISSTNPHYGTISQKLFDDCKDKNVTKIRFQAYVKVLEELEKIKSWAEFFNVESKDVEYDSDGGF